MGKMQTKTRGFAAMVTKDPLPRMWHTCSNKHEGWDGVCLTLTIHIYTHTSIHHLYLYIILVKWPSNARNYFFA